MSSSCKLLSPVYCGLASLCRQTGYSFGFGFVEYQKPEDAAKAILQLNNLPVQHKRIKVSYARPPGEDIKETNLYIQNIPRSYSLDQLDQLFAPFGQIVQKNLLKDKITGLPRGVGFVRLAPFELLSFQPLVLVIVFNI